MKKIANNYFDNKEKQILSFQFQIVAYSCLNFVGLLFFFCFVFLFGIVEFFFHMAHLFELCTHLTFFGCSLFSDVDICKFSDHY